MLMCVVLTLAPWGLSPPTSTPCVCQALSHLLRGQSHLSFSLLLSLSFSLLSLSQPLFLSLQGRGQQQGQLLLFQERKGSHESAQLQPLGEKEGGAGGHPQPPARPQVHPAGSWALPSPIVHKQKQDLQAHSVPSVHLTPSLRLRGEHGLVTHMPEGAKRGNNY